jgi:parvulin-like peptidyl-prolyl isomerase
MAAKKRTTTKPKKQSTKSTSESSNKKKMNERMAKVLRNLLFWLLLFIVSLVIVDYVVQYLNYHASVAVVNGERISRNDFYEKLEQRYGTSIASQMIDESLIFQEGEEEGITITEEEIQEQVDELETQYGGEDILNEELKSLGITREQLDIQIETTLLVEKLLESEIEITDEEAAEFFEEYKDSLFPDDENITFEEGREVVDENIREQKIAEEVQPWLTQLRSDASIQNNVEEPRSYSFLGITRDFFGELFE